MCRRPRSISRSSANGARPACSDRSVLLRVTTAVTFTTESLGSPVAAAGRKTFPGIVAKSVLDVITTATTVANRLLLYVSCLLYTSDAADDLLCVDLGGR